MKIKYSCKERILRIGDKVRVNTAHELFKRLSREWSFNSIKATDTFIIANLTFRYREENDSYLTRKESDNSGWAFPPELLIFCL